MSNHSSEESKSESPQADDDLQDGEEFSLDQLSQAYAEVLKNQTGDSSVDPDEHSIAHADPRTRLVDPTDLEITEPEDDATIPVSPESIIEAILFVGTPQDVVLTSRKIAEVLRDVSPKEVTTIVRQLNAKYEDENAAYRIESDGEVHKMVLDPNLNDFQQEFFGRNRQFKLSQAAIDVMAIVAYNQPTTRDQVEKTRGKPSGSILSQLVRRQILVVEPGTANPKIRYFSTTDRFLDLFGLTAIDDLPQSHEISDIDELAD